VGLAEENPAQHGVTGFFSGGIGWIQPRPCIGESLGPLTLRQVVLLHFGESIQHLGAFGEGTTEFVNGAAHLRVGLGQELTAP